MSVTVKASEGGLVYERVQKSRRNHRGGRTVGEACGAQDFPDYAIWPGRSSNRMSPNVAQRRAEVNVQVLGPGVVQKYKTFWGQFLRRYRLLPHVVARLTDEMLHRRVTVDELGAAAERTGWLLPWSWLTAVEQRRSEVVEAELRNTSREGDLAVPFDAPYWFGEPCDQSPRDAWE